MLDVATAYGILLPWRDVDAAHRAATGMDTEYSLDEQEQWIGEQLESKLLVFALCSAFIWLTVGEEPQQNVVDVVEELCSNYEDTKKLMVKVERRAGQPDIDERLIEGARRLMVSGKKLPFGPGYCVVSAFNQFDDDDNDIFQMGLEELCVTPTEQGHILFRNPSPIWECLNNIPMDVEILAGSGESIQMNRAVLLHYDNPLRQLLLTRGASAVSVGAEATSIVLKDITTRNVLLSVDYFVGRNGQDCVSKDDDDVLGSIAKLKDCCSALVQQQQNQCFDAPEITTENFPLYVGPEKERVMVCREVLATRNPTLSKIFFGTDYTASPTQKYLELVEFDPEGVRLVLKALMLCGQKEVMPEIPLEKVDVFVSFADYITETIESLGVKVESPIEGDGCYNAVLEFEDEDHYPLGNNAYVQPSESESDEDLDEDYFVDEFGPGFEH